MADRRDTLILAMCTNLQFHRSSDETDVAALIREMLALDRALYPTANEDDLGSVEYWAERFARCPDSLSLAREEDGTLAGYYQFLPVTAEFRRQVVAGLAHDGQIPLEGILDYRSTSREYHLYLCSMAVRPEWHGRGVASRLYNEEVLFQQKMAQRGHRAVSLLSVVWSPCGARFFERIGSPCVGLDLAGRPIHERVMDDGCLPLLPARRTQPPVEAKTAMVV